METVVGELREPLLVYPGSTVCPDEERVVMGEAVLRDLASAHQHDPRVADQHRARKDDREQRDDGDRAHDQPVRLQRGDQGSRAAIDWEGGDDRSFDTPAIGSG